MESCCCWNSNFVTCIHSVIQIVNYVYIYALNGWLLLVPWWLCFDWSMGCVPLIVSFADLRLLAPIAFLAFLVCLLYKCVWSPPGHGVRYVSLLGSKKSICKICPWICLTQNVNLSNAWFYFIHMCKGQRLKRSFVLHMRKRAMPQKRFSSYPPTQSEMRSLNLLGFVLIWRDTDDNANYSTNILKPEKEKCFLCFASF